MKAILFDLDGVIYEGDHPLPGAAEVIAWVRRQAIPHLYVTNTSSRPCRAILEKLTRMGIDIHRDELLTPALAAAEWIQAQQPGPAALFVSEATREDFAGLDQLPEDAQTGAGAVVVGDLGKQWDFPTLNRAFRLLMAEPRPRLVALGMTRYWKVADGLQLDAGPFVAALQYASEAEPLVLGKPAPGFFQSALQRLHSQPEDSLMIGDDIRGDIEGAQRAGLKAMLVRTGKFRRADLQGAIRSDAVVDSVADLPVWWEEQHRV